MTSVTLPFPHPKLTPIQGKPTNASIKILKKGFCANARAIPSLRGGGKHGHLGLVMENHAYTAVTGKAWDLPEHPGPYPTSPEGASGHMIDEYVRRYKVLIEELALAEQVVNELRQLILAAVPSIYIKVLEDDEWGMGDVTIQDIIQHLEEKYGKIRGKDLIENRDKLKTLWNPDQPMEQLWLDVQEVMRFAAAGNDPISSDSAMTMLLSAFESSSLLDTACDKWNDKPDTAKTMPAFQDHFNEENERRLRRVTAAQAGYHAANLAATSPPPPSVAPPPASALLAVQPPPAPPVVTNDGISVYYCWSHGLSVNSGHTSATCRRPRVGHQESATYMNMMGGSTKLVPPPRNFRPNAE